MSYVVEKDFISSGLRCVVILLDMGHRCGYVGVGEGHPLYKKEYGENVDGLKNAWEEAKKGSIGKRGIISLLCNSIDEARPDCVFDVHGGLTYSGGVEDYPVKAVDVWWFGFDCAHDGDGKDIDAMEDGKFKKMAMQYNWGGIVRSIEYVSGECERLASQLAAIK